MLSMLVLVMRMSGGVAIMSQRVISSPELGSWNWDSASTMAASSLPWASSALRRALASRSTLRTSAATALIRSRSLAISVAGGT
ncbi:hypothetical protein D3C72_1999770 [compost metagenome]